jgi:lipopolysaccharide/colanic/teichoic acid biosynthesis glycosyltransferase
MSGDVRVLVTGADGVIGHRVDLRTSPPQETKFVAMQQIQRFNPPLGLTERWHVTALSRFSRVDALDMDVDYARGRSTKCDLALLRRTRPTLVRRRGTA